MNKLLKKYLLALVIAFVGLTFVCTTNSYAVEGKTSSKKKSAAINKTSTKSKTSKKTKTSAGAIEKKASKETNNTKVQTVKAPEEPKPKSLLPTNSAAKVLLAPKKAALNKTVVATPSYAENITRSITVLKGESFTRALVRSGLMAGEANALSKVIDKSGFLKSSNITTGQKLSLTQSLKSGVKAFAALEIPSEKYTIQIIKTGEKKYKVRRVPTSKLSNVNVPAEPQVIPKNSNTVKKTFKSGPINSSLISLANEIGIPREVLSSAVKILSSKYSLSNKIQKHDRFSVLYEEIFDKNNKAISGKKIVFISIKGLKNNIKAYRYSTTGKDSDADYYDETGSPYRSSLTSRPLKGNVKITSGFGYRTHPILHRRILHTGTDFGAKTGTPIYAAGDGIVLVAGRYGGYGNYIKIKHDTTYETAYGHLSKFAEGMKKFKKVRRGDLIGYVGNTGRSTGAHLHFELIKRGIQIDSQRERLPTGTRLSGKDIRSFKAKLSEINSAVLRLTEKAKKR